MVNYLVTTIDNPFNPFTQSEEWNQFDQDNGYHTNAYLARITITSNELSDADQDEAINRAVDEIVRMNINGKYRRVQAPPELETA